MVPAYGSYFIFGEGMEGMEGENTKGCFQRFAHIHIFLKCIFTQ